MTPTPTQGTSASRNENRLTDVDREAMKKRTADIVAGWPAGYRPALSDHLTLERAAAHSIGIAQHDLRDAELEEIAVMVRIITGFFTR